MTDVPTFVSSGGHRPACPIAASAVLLGDKWSFVLLRDILLFGRTTFRGILTGSPERISPTVLADRLRRMTECGLLTRAPDGRHKQKAHFVPTPAARDLIPTLRALAVWGEAWLPGIEPSPEITRFTATAG